MTILTSQTVVGIDIAKAEIVVYRTDRQTTDIIKNDRTALKRWLKTLPAQSAVAVEATNIYHLDTVELAHAMGHQVYVVDAYRVSNYRRGIGQRAKNDPCDARLLARYLTNEQDELRIWNPPPKAYTSLKSLLHRRATLIQNHAGLMLSWANEPLLKKVQSAQQKAFKQADQAIQKLLRKVSKEAGIEENINRCKVDDSGKKNSPRYLTKKGDPEVRRLAYNAAMAACRSAKWKPFYESYLARGFSKTQALVALARKLCRVAFALMKNQSEYQPA